MTMPAMASKGIIIPNDTPSMSNVSNVSISFAV